jgi:hypothetical protein
VLFDVAYQSYLPSLVDRDRLVEGNSNLQASASVARVGGPGLGGLLVQLAGGCLRDLPASPGPVRSLSPGQGTGKSIHPAYWCGRPEASACRPPCFQPHRSVS